jgi:hypothetical protein
MIRQKKDVEFVVWKVISLLLLIGTAIVQLVSAHDKGLAGLLFLCLFVLARILWALEKE